MQQKIQFSGPEEAATFVAAAAAAAVGFQNQNHKHSENPEIHSQFAGAGTAGAEPAAGSESQSAGIAAGTPFAGPGIVQVAGVEEPEHLESLARKNRSIEAVPGNPVHTAAGSHIPADSHLAGMDCTSYGEGKSVEYGGIERRTCGSLRGTGVYLEVG